MKRYMALLADMRGYLDEDADGDWVRYEDAQAAVKAAEERAARAERIVDALVAESEQDADERAFARIAVASLAR